jgi:MarR-like DNA-binding transcriptional regulator SgrR of sgrS sRNA
MQRQKPINIMEAVEMLRPNLPNEFQMNEVCRLLGITPRAADEFLRQAHIDGWIERLGAGNQTRYRFIEPMYRAA